MDASEDKRWSIDREITKVLDLAVKHVIPELGEEEEEEEEGGYSRVWSMDASEDKRWSIDREITKVLDLAVKHVIPELGEEEEEEGGYSRWYQSQGEQLGDFNCINALTICPEYRKFRKDPELTLKYPNFRLPKHIGEEIKNNLEKFAGHMIRKPIHVYDVGPVAFSLSRTWLAQSIYKMLKDGIDTWAPKLPVERVILNFPSLREEVHLGRFRQQAIADMLIRMLEYSKVYTRPYTPQHEFPMRPPLPLLPLNSSKIKIKESGIDAVIFVDKKPFVLAKRDLQKCYPREMSTLGFGINEVEADWIIYVTPVRQQEYIEMCFTAAKLEGWIKTNTKGKWTPSLGHEYPVLTYAGYRTYSSKQEELANLLDQLKARCDEVAQGADAQLLGYTPEAVLYCVLMYTCLKNHRLADCTIKLDEMVKEEGNTFVYLLNRQAEVHRITNHDHFRKNINELKKASDLTLEEYEGCEEGEERMLEFHLLKFTDVLEESSLFILPHLMCNFLYDLCEKFKSYHKFACKTGSIAETSGLLLCEATAVVMDKCFLLLGITPVPLENPRSTQQPLSELLRELESVRNEKNMVEREHTAKRGIELEPEFANYFITPCSVSDARDLCRNSRFEVFSICPCIKRDFMFDEGCLFGLISVSDKYGLRSDVGHPLLEPDFCYAPLFEYDWCDPVKMHNSRVIHIDNPNPVPFSSSINVRSELYAFTKEKDACFQLCDNLIQISFDEIWDEESHGRFGCLYINGKDALTQMNYVLVKNAVDIDLEISFQRGNNYCQRGINGTILAYYGDEFSYDDDDDPLDRLRYKALLFSTLGGTPLLKSGPLQLKRSALAVPKGVSLKIDIDFTDVENTIFYASWRFYPPTEEGREFATSTSTLFDKEDWSLEVKVVWKY